MGVRKEGRKKEGRKVKEGKEEEQEKGKRLAPCLAANLSKSSHFDFKQGRLWKNVGIRVAHIGPLSSGTSLQYALSPTQTRECIPFHSTDSVAHSHALLLAAQPDFLPSLGKMVK